MWMVSTELTRGGVQTRAINGRGDSCGPAIELKTIPIFIYFFGDLDLIFQIKCEPISWKTTFHTLFASSFVLKYRVFRKSVYNQIRKATDILIRLLVLYCNQSFNPIAFLFYCRQSNSCRQHLNTINKDSKNLHLTLEPISGDETFFSWVCFSDVTVFYVLCFRVNEWIRTF